MRLRSGKTISMTSNTAQNQTSSTQNVTTSETRVTQPMTRVETVTNTAGPTAPAVSETIIPTTGPEVVHTPSPFKTLSQVVSTPTPPVFGTQASTSSRPPPVTQMQIPSYSREYSFGMPASVMAGIGRHPPLHTDNAVAVSSPLNPYQASGSTVHSNFRQNQPQASFGFNQNTLLPPITTNSVQVLRQTMDESNHEMVNTLTKQIGDVFNHLINNTNNYYQLLAQQMGRIAEFFGTPPPPNYTIPQIHPLVNQPNVGVQSQGIRINEPEQSQIVHQPIQQVTQPLGEGVVVRNNPPVVMVQRHEDPDQVVRRVQQQNFGGQNYIAQIVENILVQN